MNALEAVTKKLEETEAHLRAVEEGWKDLLLGMKLHNLDHLSLFKMSKAKWERICK